MCHRFVSDLAALSLDCQPDLVVPVAADETGSASVFPPVAFADGGDQSAAYSFFPNPDVELSFSGRPGTSRAVTYTVTDAAGDTAQCSIRLSIVLLGEIVKVRGALPSLGSGVGGNHALQ